ncbi:Ion channel [Legionella lansingensis]|uniref:Ion channel n=1 Tax=Legionella lansingensis TaxID=45067 RepID=A0A0W0VU87_9GAMM|nr:ion channel [Legionella lansingensis]KTD23615.1 Ion channel [Legionella lansingensis]SNV52419.1 Ion channel [Legionella lansingensis]
MGVLYNLIEKLRFLFLFAVLILFCLTKAVDAQFGFFEFGNLIFFVLIGFSLFIIGKGSKALLLLIAFLMMTEVLCVLLSFLLAHPMVELIKTFFAMLYFLLMAIVSLRYTLADKTIDVTTLFGSLTAYLFIGLAYAHLYLLIDRLDPQAFSGMLTNDSSVIYYSFITLTTVGFGDIYPKSPIAQTLSWFESLTGQAYLAIIMAQLVGRYVADTLHLKNKQ